MSRDLRQIWTPPVLLGVCLLCAALGGCVPADAPETHPIPLKEELGDQNLSVNTATSSDATPADQELAKLSIQSNVHFEVAALLKYRSALQDARAVYKGEKKPAQAEQAEAEPPKDAKPADEDATKPGKRYIDATSSEDRALAAKAATSYIAEQTDSRLNKLLLTPDNTYNFWRIPQYLHAYDEPGHVLVFEAYCNGQSTPDVILLIKEGDHTWTVKIFNTQQEYDALFNR